MAAASSSSSSSSSSSPHLDGIGLDLSSCVFFRPPTPPVVESVRSCGQMTLTSPFSARSSSSETEMGTPISLDSPKESSPPKDLAERSIESLRLFREPDQNSLVHRAISDVVAHAKKTIEEYESDDRVSPFFLPYGKTVSLAEGSPPRPFNMLYFQPARHSHAESRVPRVIISQDDAMEIPGLSLKITEIGRRMFFPAIELPLDGSEGAKEIFIVTNPRARILKDGSHNPIKGLPSLLREFYLGVQFNAPALICAPTAVFYKSTKTTFNEIALVRRTLPLNTARGLSNPYQAAQVFHDAIHGLTAIHRKGFVYGAISFDGIGITDRNGYGYRGMLSDLTKIGKEGPVHIDPFKMSLFNWIASCGEDIPPFTYISKGQLHQIFMKMVKSRKNGIPFSEEEMMLFIVLQRFFIPAGYDCSDIRSALLRDLPRTPIHKAGYKKAMERTNSIVEAFVPSNDSKKNLRNIWTVQYTQLTDFALLGGIMRAITENILPWDERSRDVTTSLLEIATDLQGADFDNSDRLAEILSRFDALIATIS